MQQTQGDLDGTNSIKKEAFSNHDLFSLFLPLIIEQGLEYTVGMGAAMFADWIVKSVIYEWHYKSDKWTLFDAI